MIPSQLDESLLTAYLDGELSEQERVLVEEQLKVNEHWKQLLIELRNVQSLIRELPTPVLSRSLSEGPWSQNTQQNATVGTIERSTPSVDRRSFPMSILAIAASLLLCAVGSFAWMRYGKDDLQVAKMEKNENINAMDRDRDELAATAADMKNIAEPSIAPSAAIAREESRPDLSRRLGEMKSENAPMAAAPESELSIASPEAPKLMLKRRSPMPDPTSESANQNGRDRRAEVEPQRAQRSGSTSPEPVDTIIAVRAKSLDNAPQGGMASGLAAGDMQAGTQGELLPQLATTAAPSSLQSNRFNYLEKLGRPIDLAKQPQELRIMRSDLPLVLQMLREQGWVVQYNTNPIEGESLARQSMQRLSKAEATPNKESVPRPPTLTGAISEPTDWVRIIFQGE